MGSNVRVGRLAMLAGLALGAGAASGQWLDNFNRTDGPIGGTWISAGGSFGDFTIDDFRGAHTIASSAAMRSTTADSNYYYVGQTLDISKTASGVGYVALAAGYGGTNNLFIKLQGTGSVFDRIGFYSGLNDSTGWPVGAGFEELFETFSEARVQLSFLNGGEKMAMAIDIDKDGRPDTTWVRSGVKAFSTNFGTGMGIGAYGNVRFDNYRVMPTIVPPAPVVVGNTIPFSSGFSGTMHQVFRSGMYLSPVRINTVRFFPSQSGLFHSNLNVKLGYTSRLPGLASPAGLSLPDGPGGGPNAIGSMHDQWVSSNVSVNLTAEDDAFPLGLAADDGFVYFPGIGNLLLEVTATQYPDSEFTPMWRSDGSVDSSRSYRSNVGDLEDFTRALRVQYGAMPYLPDVLPTRAFLVENAIPFDSGLTVNHQVHHSATLSHLADGGDKVAIQGIAYAPVGSGAINGALNVRLGYTLRRPELASPAGLAVPNAGGGGAPNASAPMKSFFSGMVNRSIVGGTSSNYQFDLHQQPFVYDWTLGHLLIETQTPASFSGMFVARTAASPESSRAFTTSVYGGGNTGASKIKFLTTPVRETAFPAQGANNGLLVPFGRGVHVVDQVFTAAQFGSEPVRISSIAFAPSSNGLYSATDVTVRLGYTGRQPNLSPPVGLSIPSPAGGGDPNAAIQPMTVFRSGPYSRNMSSAGDNNYQLELEGDVPFLYNPAMGNLLVEISAEVPNSTLDLATAATTGASQDSSLTLSSTRFAPAIYPSYANIVQFSYFKDLYPCLSDLTGNGAVDLEDFFAFFGCFDTGAQCADFDGVPGVDLGDFFAFFNSFDVGC